WRLSAIRPKGMMMSLASLSLLLLASSAPAPAGALRDDPVAATANDDQQAKPAQESGSGEIVVTARRREERAQDVPIAMSVIGGSAIEQTGATNLNRLQTSLPAVQFYSSNPRNSAINIRGLG